MALDPQHLTGIPTMLMRGGTSKGLFFLAEDLPSDVTERDELLLRLMGSPDPRQIDGLGGAHPLTSKVAIVSQSRDGESDVDYLFLQISVDEALVSDRQNCGNMVAAVAPFALERGLVPYPTPTSAVPDVTVRIRLLNTGGQAVATVPTRNGSVRYDGSTSISGVPKTAAAISLDFYDTMGSSCGSLFPSGNIVDQIDGVDVTMIDNGMPVVLLTAASMGIKGTEQPEELSANTELRAKLESVRLQAGQLMNLGDVATTTIPKMTMVSPPTGKTANNAALNTRTFIPHRCHDAIGVLGAVSVATAIQVEGTIAHQVASSPTIDANNDAPDLIAIEHPTGTFGAAVRVSMGGGLGGTITDLVVERSGIVRTARKLMDGLAFPYQDEHRSGQGHDLGHGNPGHGETG